MGLGPVEVDIQKGTGAGAGGPCVVRFNAPWVMVIWDPPTDRLTDTYD